MKITKSTLKQMIQEEFDKLNPMDLSRFEHLIEKRIRKSKKLQNVGFDEVMKLIEECRTSRDSPPLETPHSGE